MLLVGCQSEYCDKLCQSVHTYNHLPLPHTKACEQTWNLSTKQRGRKKKRKQQQNISWQSMSQLCCSSSFSWMRLVPAWRQMCPRRSPSSWRGEGRSDQGGMLAGLAARRVRAVPAGRGRILTSTQPAWELMPGLFGGPGMFQIPGPAQKRRSPCFPLKNKVDFP